MAAYALHALEAHVKGWRFERPVDEDLPWEEETHGLFVTYEMGGKLCGCMGTFERAPLYTALNQFAVDSGSRDARFHPVNMHDLSPSLDCTVTLLTPRQAAIPWDNWVAGVHGVQMTLTEGEDTYFASFLPDVVREQGWSRKQTLAALIHKSGYPREVTEDTLRRCSVSRYESTVGKCNYIDYKESFRDRWSFLLA
eukprot:TRINITY_DN16566_c0_g1_i2.p1 TRINITY_DN16566_c0_g1~~TRINITY_DN16566_c0_g1_i2.p1  ORF type:complete len:223 (+),score=64.08 TRINITY_DN16566_c0_g1_i2:82-669(+)